MDRGTWQAAVYRVSQSLTQLKQLSTHTISLSIMSTSFIHIVAHIQISFLKLNTLCVSITFCFSTHLLMDILVVSTSWLSWIMLLWTWNHKDLFKSLISSFSGLLLEVELLDQMEVLCLLLWVTGIPFSIETVPFYIPNSYTRDPLSPHHHQHLLFSSF